MTIDQYIQNINAAYQRGNATEHTYRGDLKQLIESLVVDIVVTNEPSRQSCGAPDYILTKKDIPVGFIEAKDIGDKDLEGAKKIGNKEQFDRYKASLHNLIFTDYLDFYLYRAGQFVLKIAIGEITPKGIKPIHSNFSAFTDLIKDFCSYIGQTITSSKKLAEMMAGKARLLSVIIEKALTSDETNNEDSTLKDQMDAFRHILIHNITPKGFADVYAQTIAYGMFAARTHDKTIDTFSRSEAAELIPKSNPFLRRLFGYIAGPDIDDRIKWIVDSLAEIFLACNVMELLKDYGKATKMEDPIIHFYETFLSEYDPALRKARGVWYTPQPVVNFIVRAVDDILKTEFDLPDGLADTSKTKIKVQDVSKATSDMRSITKQIEREVEVHKVQILDPATGTGTFLAEVIRQVHKKFEGQQGIWSNYVETHLLPRINGFEILMASYAMAHLKLDLLLTETGYKSTPSFGHPSNGGELRRGDRLRVYLTNSLEESHPDTGTLFANWLSTEANEANHIKRDTPVMCVIGNPPYSVSSTNKGEWIQNLIADYKKDLNERNIQPLSDDYIKFIRYGQHFIDKNGNGILAYISNNSFLDGLIHKQMRKNLLESFDKIYILDLHGNSKKKESSPDGSPDQNVFDIMQGVSINIFVKTGKKSENELGKVSHFDLYGKRDLKYEFLNENSLNSISWGNIGRIEPDYFFVKKDFTTNSEYESFLKVKDLFVNYSAGIQSKRDGLFMDNSLEILENRIRKLINETLDTSFINEFNVTDSSSYLLTKKIKQVRFDSKYIRRLHYRPFNDQYIYYDPSLIGRSFFPVMRNLLHSENLGLVISKQFIDSFKYVLVSNKICDMNLISSAGSFGAGFSFPLYIYPEKSNQQTIGLLTERTPNLNAEIVKQIAEGLGLEFVAEKNSTQTEDLNSPPLEGCPKGGVVNSPSMEGCPKGGVVNSLAIVNSPNPKDIVTYINHIPIKRNFVENLPHNPALIKLNRDKRKAGILSEVLFWQQVHQGKFHKIDFDRQRIIGNYIVDFYVKTLGLIVEIDGDSHYDKIEHDARRHQYLESLGLRVYRIADGDVKNNLDNVMLGLERYVVSEYGETTTPDVGHPSTPDCVHPSKGGESATPAFSHPSEGGEFAPIDLLDYIYAVLHSPTYREKYKEFLKIDFPRVPYPKDRDTFWQLVKLGGELRQIHLLESPVINRYITQYPVDGDNMVRKIRFEPDLGRTYINDTQYFDHVPNVAWNFYIGGYQPAQKWLKDRKDRKLEFDDLLHYQKIVVALTETDRIMKEIDGIEI